MAYGSQAQRNPGDVVSRATRANRIEGLKGALESASAALSAASPYLTVASAIWQRIDGRRAEKQAREAALDARAIRANVLSRDLGKSLPVAFGRFAVEGLNAYYGTGQNFPFQPDHLLGDLVYHTQRENGLYDRHTAPTMGNSRFEFLLVQEMLTRHEIEALRTLTVDGAEFWSKAMVAELGAPGVASEMATRFDLPPDGNGLNERNSKSTFPLGSFATCVLWNDVDNAPQERLWVRIPRIGYHGLGMKTRPVTKTGSTYAVGTRVYSTSAPLALLELFMADWGMGVETPSQASLKSFYDAVQYAAGIMQGHNGLWEEAYPAIFNTIEGTDYEKYKHAFVNKGYLSFSALTHRESRFSNSADPGSETGWNTGRELGSFIRPWDNGNFIVQRDDQNWVIRRGECNGTLIPGRNLRDMIASVMQTMPFASFSRALEDGERRLVIPNLQGAVPAGVMTIDEDTIRDLSIEPPANPPSKVTIQFRNTNADGLDGSISFPRTKIDDMDTPAREYIKGRFGERENEVVIFMPLVDNQMHAYYLAWCVYQAASASTITVSKHGNNEYADVGDIVNVQQPSRGRDLKALVTAQVLQADLGQRIVGTILNDHMAAWAVTQKEDTPHEELYVRPLAPSGGLCAEWNDAEQVVVLDFDCERDADGNIIPKFPRNCDDPVDVYNGSETRVPLPVYGPGDPSYAVTISGSPGNTITYDARTHEIVVTATAAESRYEVEITGTIGDHTAVCRFSLGVTDEPAEAVGWRIEFVPSFGLPAPVNDGGDNWRMVLGRGQNAWYARPQMIDLTGQGLPDSATARYGTAADAPSETANKAPDGSIVFTGRRYDYGADQTVNTTEFVTITAAGKSRTERIFVWKDAR